jgi:hypothetical protein
MWSDQFLRRRMNRAVEANPACACGGCSNCRGAGFKRCSLTVVRALVYRKIPRSLRIVGDGGEPLVSDAWMRESKGDAVTAAEAVGMLANEMWGGP